MPKREWKTILPLLGLGGLVLRAGRAAADDGDDGTGDDGDGSNGDGGDNGGSDPITFDNTITIEKYADGFATYPETNVTFHASGKARAAGDISDGEWSQDMGSASTSLVGSESLTIDYNGSIETLDWAPAPITVHVNGNRSDPYDIARGGPRYRWVQGTSDVVETTVYQSAAQYIRQGPESAETAAQWLSEALRDHGISHDILFGLPAIDMPTEDTSCTNPFRGDDPCYGDDSCSSWDCCTVEDSMPSAYYWWRSELNEGGFQQRYSDAIGQNVSTRGDSYVQRKDSNILLSDMPRGGCGAVNGSQCVIGADSIGERDYSPDRNASREVNQLHNVMHEFGHNMGYGHPRDDCSKGGGEAWIDDMGRWNRTPCVPGNGCVNKCGFYIENRSGTTSNQVMFHPYFTECTAQQFKDNAGPEAGNVQEMTFTGKENDGWGDEDGCTGC